MYDFAMNWRDIIKRKMREKGITQEDMGEHMGLTPSMIGHKLKPVDHKDHRGTNVEQMLEMAMLVNADTSELFADLSNQLVTKSTNANYELTNKIALPVKELSTLNKKTKESALDNFLVDNDWFYQTTGIKPHDKLEIIRINNDAMSPTLNEDDLVVIDKTQTERINGIFVFRDDSNQITLKRLDFKGKKTTIKNDNPLYDNRTINTDKIKLIARVRFSWHSQRI